MIEISGYQMIDEIGSYDDIKLYRMIRQVDNLQVIAKTTCDVYPGPNVVAAFQHEYDLLMKLGGRGTLEAYGLIILADRPVLFLQDIGGSTLDQVLRTRDKPFMHATLLGIAAAAADSLMQIHREKIILNEISPFHLIANPDTYEVKFIDIRMCSTDLNKSLLPLTTGRPDFILPYISPEQTGRTGMTPDYRSDFYSLGVTLYEWMSGSLPFESQDVWDVIYRHLASTPEPLHKRYPSIPEMVSAIVSKCMEKMPDARYASAFGIKSDLEECLKRFQATGEVGVFALASSDIPDRWRIPSHYYGRISEQQSLQEALQRASYSAAEVIWVSGNEGIGKTSFVNETLRKSMPLEVYFVTGKFNPQQAARPYDVWIQAIDELVSLMLMESKLQAEVWKLRIVDALNGYGQLLIELVPKLELLIGEQPSIQPLPPVEAQRRFHLILSRFIKLFLQRDCPLVLFFDDLQYADEESLQYLAYLLEDRDTNHLLVILAYRDGEITPLHPLSRLEKHLEEQNTRSNRIHLKALEAIDLSSLLSDTMGYEAAETNELAYLLLHKTEGNPFFLKQFLQDLVDDKQVIFDESSRRWQWSLQHIAERNVPNNSADYISDKMKLFSDQTVYVLGRAAVLGTSFDVDTLVAITNLPLQELEEVLGNAEREQLLQPVKFGNGNTHQFQHDRIQQAAYHLVSEDELPKLHWSIGSLLADRMKLGEDTNIFEVVNHFNQARNQIERPEQKLELAELNLQAALKAKQSTAYETSLGYLRHATALIEEDSWKHSYSLAFRSFRERAEAEYLCGHFAKANDLFNLLISRAETNLDKALVCTMKIQLEATNDNYGEVISLGHQTLELLNIRHHFEPSTFELTLQWLKLSRKLKKHPIESLQQLPLMTDEVRKAAMTAMVYTSNASFFVNKKGWLATTFTMIEMTLDYGMTPESSIGFVGYAMFLNFHFRHYKEAFEWGMLACELSKPYPILHVKTLTSFTLCNDSWRQFDPMMLKTFTEHAGKVGLESGDLWHSNQSVLINCAILLQYGHPLGDIYNRLIAHSGDFLRHNNSLHWKQAVVLVDLLVRLTGYRAPNDPFEETDIYSEDFAGSVHGDQFNTIQELVCTLQYLPGYIFGQYQEANEALKRAAAIINARQDKYESTVQYLYESLVLAQLYEDASIQEQKVFLTTIRKHLKRMKVLAARCPENYKHKYLLIKAEVARITRKNRQAEELFEQSIEAARAYGYIHDVGIAAECLAKFALRHGKQQLAKIYMTEAYEAYLEWGATAKAAVLEQKYGHLLHIRRESGLESVDYLSAVMSAQALSGEMEMNRLLDTLMRIMLHNAGAEYGVLIFGHEDNWVVEAYGTADEQHIETVPLEAESEIASAAIIGYAARTKEEVVLHDAAHEGMFVRNPYVKNNGLKSVLCLPIMHQNKLICLLYMENRLSTSVFTPQRLDVLKLLGSQCAISIENAKLYSGIQYLKNNLEAQVVERTRSLERSMRETSAALAEASVYEERNRIAHDIHDIVGHSLTSTILQIEAGKRLLLKDMEGGMQRLKEAQDLARHSLNEIRGSVHMLKEDKFADLGQMLNQLIRDTERNMEVDVHSAIHQLPKLSTAHKKAIYHALQEGLTNGIRHGGSKEFRFSLQSVGTYLQFRLEDCGTGAPEITLGFGLKAMKERVEQLGGSLSVESWPNQGCLLKIDLPYKVRLNGDRE
ncbi:AAA family ATPase [Bacillus sp. FJAT-28004]|uniref:AAA family ATPase n=1 Tax=Bacillus sp. FJAT-28004 TaxID=1679165 RepID=UPI0006B5E348|nr:AAA family ATPase [Bacillus sp. FJAT-28004]